MLDTFFFLVFNSESINASFHCGVIQGFDG